MPDIRLNTITNDVKARNIMDIASTEFSNTQFLEAMMSGIGASSDAEAAKRTAPASSKEVKSVRANAPMETKEKPVRKEAVKDKAPVNAAAQERAEVHAKIKARLKEIADNDTTPIKDTKALKTLQKVAKSLIKANEDGQIDLPPEMVQKLQEFIAKGDDLRAFDIANFMNDFADMFRSLKVAMPQAVQASEFKWPDDVIAAFDDLGMKNAASSADKPLTKLDVLRAVKALVNDSQQAAIRTLDENAQSNVAGQDQASLMLAGLGIEAKIADPKSLAPKKLEPKNVLVNEMPAGIPAALAKEAAPIDSKPAPQAAPIILPLVKQQTQDAKDVPLTDAAKSAAPKKHADPSSQDIKEKPAAQDLNPKLNAQLTTPSSADLKAAIAASAAQPAFIQPLKTETSTLSATQGIHSLEGISMNGTLTGAKAVTAATAPHAANGMQQNNPVQQVIVNIQQKINKATQLSIQLTPVELGQVEIRLDIKRDGQAHAVIMAEKPETLALLQKDASQLEKALQQAGISTNSENMSFSLRDDRNAQQFGQQSKKRFSREAITEKIGTDIAINVLPSGQIFSDTQINYHA